MPLLFAGFEVAHPLLVGSELPVAMLIGMDVLRPHAASFSVCDSTSLQFLNRECAVCLEHRVVTRRESRDAPAVVCAIEVNQMPMLPLPPPLASLSASKLAPPAVSMTCSLPAQTLPPLPPPPVYLPAPPSTPTPQPPSTPTHLPPCALTPLTPPLPPYELTPLTPARSPFAKSVSPMPPPLASPFKPILVRVTKEKWPPPVKQFVYSLLEQPRDIRRMAAEVAENLEWSYQITREIISFGHRRAESRYNERIVEKQYKPGNLVRVVQQTHPYGVQSKLNPKFFGL